ncbi:MAG: thiamine diphosphokinase [Clostridium sp.]|uniref:thiamine diphosphokinase n=1 Tax=Clostridium sp. TaxID=1506 RepID=UPI003064C1F6
MRAIIVGGGEAPSKPLIEKYMDQTSIIIAADGGANILYSYDITPTYLIGDFDSIEDVVYKKLSYTTNTTRFPREKDYTDSHIAFNRAVELGADEIVFLGCTGKRIDHFMANISILYEGLKKSISCYIVDEINEIFLIDKSTVIEGILGQVFSLFSYGEDTLNLKIEGAKYPLEGYNLSTVDNLTVSNEFIGKKVKLEFTKGCLLVIKIT